MLPNFCIVTPEPSCRLAWNRGGSASAYWVVMQAASEHASAEQKLHRSTLRTALASGTVASVLSALVLALCSKVEEGHAAGGINGPSQWIWGEAEAYTRRATWRHTAVGYAIHHATSIFWAALHELTFGRTAQRKNAARICAEAAATTATAYVVDYHVTPRRLRPGFDKHLGALSMLAVYAAFGAGLAWYELTRTPDRLAAVPRSPRRSRAPRQASRPAPVRR
jgi:hypothetical protein